MDHLPLKINTAEDSSDTAPLNTTTNIYGKINIDNLISISRFMKICKYHTGEDMNPSMMQCPKETNYPW